MSNEQKVAIITGGSQGIGAGLVKAFRDRNYRVVATSRSIKPDRRSGHRGGPRRYRRSGDRRSVIAKEADARFGRIDTLVNNAGIFIAKPFTDYTARGLRRRRSRPISPASSTSRSASRPRC